MEKSAKLNKKTMFTSTVLSNAAVSKSYYAMTIELDEAGSVAFSNVIPGQFAEFDLRSASVGPRESIPEELRDASQRQVLLCRPFSFFDFRKVLNTNPEIVRLGILYCVLGPATLRMSALSKGDQIGMIGPLGNGFSVPEGTKHALLVGGGIGTPPLMHLAEYLTENCPQIKTVAFAGARSVENAPFTMQIDNEVGATVAEFARYEIETHIATDDGSIGHKGVITECVEKWLGENSFDAASTMIYACGREEMLAAIAKVAEKNNIVCQVSMERMMACGTGLCQSCAITKKTEGGEGEYKLCCKDGPVFDSREIVFGERL